MPGLVTHYIFGHSVLNELNENDKITINKHFEIFNIGTQGPDLFFYYLPGLVRKQTKELGLIMHKKKINNFLRVLLKEMDKLKGSEREIAFSYVAGYLTHYALDYSTHKYIYYKTGFRQRGKPIQSNKYSLLHKKLETNIDIMLYNVLSEETIVKNKTWQLLNADKKDATVIMKVMSRAVEDVYGRYIQPSDIKNAILYMKNLTKVLGAREEKFRKYRKLKPDLNITKNEIEEIVKLQETIGLGVDYFNLNNNEWCSPCDLEEKHNESFLDLYKNGHYECVKIITALFDFCDSTKTLEEVMKIIGNYSMATGLDCDNDKPFRYFELI